MSCQNDGVAFWGGAEATTDACGGGTATAETMGLFAVSASWIADTTGMTASDATYKVGKFFVALVEANLI